MIEYRRPMPAEAPAFWALLDALDHENRYMLYEPGERPRDLTRVETVIGGQEDFLLCALNGEEMVGFLWGQRGVPRRARHIAYVVTGVRRAWQRQGVASRLFENLDAWARSAGVTRLELYVVKSNLPAIRLYEKEGFEDEGLRRRAMRLDGEYVDEIYMGKLL